MRQQGSVAKPEPARQSTPLCSVCSVALLPCKLPAERASMHPLQRAPPHSHLLESIVGRCDVDWAGMHGSRVAGV